MITSVPRAKTKAHHRISRFSDRIRFVAMLGRVCCLCDVPFGNVTLSSIKLIASSATDVDGLFPSVLIVVTLLSSSQTNLSFAIVFAPDADVLLIRFSSVLCFIRSSTSTHRAEQMKERERHERRTPNTFMCTENREKRRESTR
jgi:hypothetical protein